MTTRTATTTRAPWLRAPVAPWALSLFAVGVLVTTACSSSSKQSTAVSSGSSPSTSSAPGTSFSTANVPGLGTVVVDGTGRTVYVLTADGKTNVPCDDASGCTKIWPDLPFPNGTTSATAGTGAQTSLLGSMKLSDGETYPTYNRWLMYEYSGDGGPAQGHGEGIQSYGGTWYALDASGNLVMPASGGPTATTAAASTGSGGGY